MTAGSIVAPQIIPIRAPLPGIVKHQIDTTTPVEIKSDTPDVTIYYTLDGSKPEVPRRPGLRDSSKLQYKEPICLPKGKVYVKALASTGDGRESAVVTKVFLVDHIPSDDPLTTEGKPKREQEMCEGGDSFAKWTRGLENTWEGSSKEQPAVTTRGSHSLKTSSSPRPRKPPSSKQLASIPPSQAHSQYKDVGWGELSLRSLTKTQLSRIQRETDFLRCAQCLFPRPSDPFARFCLQCGAPVPPIPGQRLPPTEGAQLGLCVSCKTMVPLNAVTCVVCEAPLEQQRQPQAAIRLSDKVICPACGTGNPAHIDLCVACETRLLKPATAVLSGLSAPPVPKSDGKMVCCSKCSRINTLDARFCDWCGSKPSRLASHVSCSQCGSTSHPYANFCGSCGVFLAGPPRSDSRTGMAHSREGAPEQENTFCSDAATWQPVPSASPPATGAPQTPCRIDRHTQTVGLFYPSGADLQRKSQRAAQNMARQEQMSDRKPLLSAVSPGRGYWRQQLDHVCAHLRSYTQNSPEFRGLMGEPRMGKMTSAVIQEDGYEVSLTLSFALASPDSHKECFVEKTLDRCGNLLSSVTEGADGLSDSQSSLASENGGMSLGTSLRRRRIRRKKDAFDSVGKLPESLNDRLLRELGPTGMGQIPVVQQLLDEGADPSCQSTDGRPAVTVAVMNLHHEVIPLLVQKGADVDQQSGPVNNTALHEAAACGTRGLQCAETLLGCSASIKKKNDRGLTVHDLAVQSGCSALITQMAVKMGQGLLDKLSRPGKNGSLEMF
ncbi:double zinc ribbon and ankyrin repeat-containing protein 1 isoform X1 [Brienomyrus brachyistius]|uniref:double zinc ribbon and ankyrin repeat-containing protein 1 isoform X1 n=1 Tax=Brienomyrus brachyistius TaxID=42636 RepID=UPI0020B1A05A|nr:double zinc ribbon and ankyrin repeat-containing protein 1 isoform X1 [Brienomyrus brachyistius]